MPKHSTVPAHLTDALVGSHPHIQIITNIAINLDRHLSIGRKSLVAYIAGRIAAGQRKVSYGEAARACGLSTDAARTGLVALTGEYLEAERRPGPGPTRWRLRMPTSVNLPLAQRSTKPQPVIEHFDADRHRALGIKVGHGTYATTELERLLRNLTTPRKAIAP